ncbi:alpha/beta fold hydrolase [Gangjinia marincola]|uniref:Alpha/beta fold hydrolase n=1 Tax=Gangjinia marincola TaxID=578463 RepID=A0ABP3XSM0_9FLAO
MTTIPLSLKYKLRPSSLSSNAPVIIMFHGYGSNEEDLFSFAPELPPEYLIISVRAPYPMQPYGNAWYAIHWDNVGGKFSDDEQAISSRNKISQFIDEIVAHYPVDPKQVTLLGFSQGTILSYAVALSYPEKVSRVIGLSGYINEGILAEGYAQKSFDHLTIYTSHGSVDQVIPVSWARKVAPFLDQLSIEHKYAEFPVGHGVSPQNFKDLNEFLANT